MTNAELALLGLIVEQPRHGYAVKAAIDERGMREWADLGMSSIYHVLHRLQRAGLIEAQRSTESRGPDRKVFHPTQAGRKAAAEGIRRALAEPQRDHSRFLLGLANLPTLSPEVGRTALSERKVALVSERDRLAAIRRGLRNAPTHVAAMFGYSDALIDAEIGWLERYEEDAA